MGRAPCCDKAIVKRGPWSPEEDIALRSYVEKHGTGGNWIALPQKAGLRRCGKSCRLRWLNYLRPGIKHGGFTEEEDNIICSLYKNIGSRWSVIASHLPGRTDNDVKNYWNTKLKKKLVTAQANMNQPSSNNSVDGGGKSSKHARDSSTSSSPLAGVSVPVDKSDKQSFGSFSESIDHSCSPSTLTSMDGAFVFNPHFRGQVAEPASAFPSPVNTQLPNNGGSSKGFVVSPPEDVSAASSSLATDHTSRGYVPWADNCSGAGFDAFLMELGFGQMDFLGVGGYGLFDKMGEVIGSFPAVTLAGAWPSADS